MEHNRIVQTVVETPTYLAIERSTVFPKNEEENLYMAERNALRKRADNIFETYER
jgi:hypothetical protein